MNRTPIFKLSLEMSAEAANSAASATLTVCCVSKHDAEEFINDTDKAETATTAKTMLPLINGVLNAYSVSESRSKVFSLLMASKILIENKNFFFTLPRKIYSFIDQNELEFALEISYQYNV